MMRVNGSIVLIRRECGRIFGFILIALNKNVWCVTTENDNKIKTFHTYLFKQALSWFNTFKSVSTRLLDSRCYRRSFTRMVLFTFWLAIKRHCDCVVLMSLPMSMRIIYKYLFPKYTTLQCMLLRYRTCSATLLLTRYDVMKSSKNISRAISFGFFFFQ